MTARLTVWSRAMWGARPAAYASTPRPRRRDRLWLHHTDRLPASVGLGADAVRWVQGYHQGLGWADIGYPFLYSPATRVFYVGHDPERQGAHTRGANHDSHALAVLGDYHRTPGDPLPGHVVDDLAAFLRWYAEQGYGPSRFTGGHRDAPDASTACPGDRLHALLGPANRAAANLNHHQDQGDDMPTAQEIAEAVWSHQIGQEGHTARKWLADTFRHTPARVWAERFGPENHTARHWVARGTRATEGVAEAVALLERVTTGEADAEATARQVVRMLTELLAQLPDADDR